LGIDHAKAKHQCGADDRGCRAVDPGPGKAADGENQIARKKDNVGNDELGVGEEVGHPKRLPQLLPQGGTKSAIISKSLRLRGLHSPGILSAVIFRWDRRKAAVNLKKHGVDFREAATVLYDPLSVTFPDEDHSEDEHRFLTVGQSARNRLLVVAHTEEGDTIRIISARPVTWRERKFYEES
jgi:uncharacterized protein